MPLEYGGQFPCKHGGENQSEVLTVAKQQLEMPIDRASTPVCNVHRT